MGLGFKKSMKIAPGIKVNVGKKGVGMSFGGKGMRHTIHSSGRRTSTVGIPGSGISYSTSSSGKKYKTSSHQSLAQLRAQEREIKKLEALEQAKFEVDMFETKCEAIKSIHKECDEAVNWQEIQVSLPPFEGAVGPEESKAQDTFNNYKPSFFDKLMKKEEKKRTDLRTKIIEAKREDESAYESWKELVNTANKVLQGDIDTYFEVIQEMDPLGDLTDFGSGFEFSTTDHEYIEVNFDVHSDSVVPQEEKKLTKTGKLSTKQMPKSRYYELTQDYVCSCALRIAQDLFALLPINRVVVHALDENLNSQTGLFQKDVVLSVVIDREQLDQINLDLIDCSDSMDNFNHNMSFKKTKGFSPVEKITVSEPL